MNLTTYFLDTNHHPLSTNFSDLSHEKIYAMVYRDQESGGDLVNALTSKPQLITLLVAI
ncbi:hypothetical protein OAF68_01625 [Akkermansiaceae bacterium]|nr:hypothetical protein [Akkermansiaceae bacterium]